MRALREEALALGAFRAELVRVEDISPDVSFRSLCASNACGNYGKNYMCPPDVGSIEELMQELRTYETALVYQTVGLLEDSYDFEGMMEAGNRHNELAQKLRSFAGKELEQRKCARGNRTEEGCDQKGAGQGSGIRLLHLGAGGCRVCTTCGKRSGEPCLFPEKAIGSLEAYGVNVSLLARTAGMRYINGQNTVTYFGAILCRAAVTAATN